MNIREQTGMVTESYIENSDIKQLPYMFQNRHPLKYACKTGKGKMSRSYYNKLDCAVSLPMLSN